LCRVIALAAGLVACHKGFTVAFTTAAALVNPLMELARRAAAARAARPAGGEAAGRQARLYTVVAEGRRATVRDLLASADRQSSPNLPFVNWTSVLRLELLTGALLDRLTHHIIMPPHQLPAFTPPHSWEF
jgi:hypothetical protein